MAKPLQELQELLLLVLEPAERLRTIFVEGVIAARWLPPAARAVPTASRPAHIRKSVPFPATHASAPDEKDQEGQAQRPEQDEGDDQESDPGGFPEVVDFCCDFRHVSRPCKC